MELISVVEHRMVELKARIVDFQLVRSKIERLGARYKETNHQTDTYFDVPHGRLKLREETKTGSERMHLIYYEREDVKNPKSCTAFILRVDSAVSTFKELLKLILKATAIIEKSRSIYIYTIANSHQNELNVQLHLDQVNELGTFIEFELETSEKTLNRDTAILKRLLNDLEIKPNQLEKTSYADLLLSRDP